MAYTQEQLDKWNRVVTAIKNSDDISPISFRQWIVPMQLHTVTADEVIVISPMLLAMGAIRARYHSMIEAMVRTIFGFDYSLTLCEPDRVPQQHTQKSVTLNPKYRFENFVTGDANRFAYATALAVAEDPGNTYNPYFIYGDVGLGKTHLMNAIGNFILEQNPNTNILSTTSEAITNDLVESILKRQGGSELRNRMRNVDVLMVDDIQFLAKTNRTQEEFFHAFNDLFNNHKQIILTSDRPPNELPAIEERLRSRFGMGLIVDVRKPEYETRIAILQQKAEEAGISVPDDAVQYIASHFDKSIRDLEGALTRVVAECRMTAQPITLESATRALASLITTTDPRKITPALIIETCAKRFSVSVDDVLSSKRSRNIVEPRQIAMYLCRELTELSTTAIGSAFGGRDHTTVLHGCEKVADQIKKDIAYKRKVDEVAELVRNA